MGSALETKAGPDQPERKKEIESVETKQEGGPEEEEQSGGTGRT